MSALSAIEAALVEETQFEHPMLSVAERAAQRGQRLRLTTGSSRPDGLPARRPDGTGSGTGDADQGTLDGSGSTRAPGHLAGAGAARGAGSGHRNGIGLQTRPMNRPQAGHAALRLTRRGRLVASIVTVALAALVLTVALMLLPGGAQAANHGRPGAGYQGMRQIVVQPGQTLWSIAVHAEPSADPRLVIAQIMTANSLTSTAVQAGEELWVPK